MRKTILSLALAVAMMAALTACSGGGDPVGTYEATKMGDSSGEYSIDDAEQNGFFEISNALEIKSDGNATLTFTRTISPEAEKQMSAQDLATAKRIYSLGTESGSGTWEMKSPSSSPVLLGLERLMMTPLHSIMMAAAIPFLKKSNNTPGQHKGRADRPGRVLFSPPRYRTLPHSCGRGGPSGCFAVPTAPLP